jgi:hypothetical protein
LLVAARPAKRARPTAPRNDRADYTTIEHAGKPHRGKITDAEQLLVQQHFDEINERLAAQGLRTISLDDPEHVERYALTKLAAATGAAGKAASGD